MDTMNPKATEAFIRSAHEKYEQTVGEEFGRAVPAIFTDEPRMWPRKKQTCKISTADSNENIIIPYTEYFAEQMKAHCDTDVLDRIPEYIWELPESGKSPFRCLCRWREERTDRPCAT